jgi:glutathione S-transferase
VNPLKKVPALRDADGFCLPESHAILRFLCDTHAELAGRWYPRDARSRALVDAALSWAAGALRSSAAQVVWHRVIAGNVGQTGDQRYVDEHGLPALREALAVLEGHWLQNGRRSWVAGGADASVADLAMACEVEQLSLLDAATAGGPTGAELMADLPAVRAWLGRLASRCAPHYADAHAVLRKVRAQMLAAKGRVESNL